MKTLTAPIRNVLPFVSRVQSTTSVRTKLSQHGLLELPLPAAFGGGASLVLCGENILLAGAGDPRCRYGCCAYVVADGGRKALPVIGCRAWFHAPLPAQPRTHPVWADLEGGLLEAVNRVGEAAFNLDGAIVAARSWMSRRHAEVSAHLGSAVLTGCDTHVLCAAMSPDRPAQSVAVPVASFQGFSVRRENGLRMAA